MKCLLLTRDVTLSEVIRFGFSVTNVALEMCPDATSAIELSGRQHLAGFIIDCDVVERATDLLAQIRNSVSNKRSVLVTIVNARTSVSMAIDAGANFVLSKPLQDKQLRSFVDIALPRMEREHRRYFRHKVNLPVELLCHSGETFAGNIINMSESGLALTRLGSCLVDGVVTVRFALPSANRKIFQAKADVAWNDAFAVGLRFLRIEPSCSSEFAAWLDSLQAHLQLRKSTQQQ